MKLNELTIVAAAQGLQNGEFSSVELTEACLARIKERNGTTNAFITVLDSHALEQADAADKRIASGDTHPLTGIPYSVKDTICTQGVRSTGGATILDTYIAPYQASVIRNMQEQGGVLIGKTNCDAFGHGASNENSMYGPVKNPHDESRVAGGSSGGAAASVVDNMCIYSIAEDTGGSIRQPASFCGVVGLRPSYGRNSRYGVMPMASSYDTVGPMTKTVEDCAIVMQTMAGHDPRDATTVRDDVPAYTEELSGKEKLRIGVPSEYFEHDGIETETKNAVLGKINKLVQDGHEVVEISLPHTIYAVPVYYIGVPCEDSSNLGRLDGIRYGSQVQGETLYDMYALARAQGFPEEVKRRIMIGTYALSAGYYDEYYRRSQKVRTLILRDFDTVFDDVDVLMTPTSPFQAFKLGEKKDDVLAMYLADIFVSPAAIAGLPAISIPVGKDSKGLPIGLQVIGPRLQESRIMRFAHTI